MGICASKRSRRNIYPVNGPIDPHTAWYSSMQGRPAWGPGFYPSNGMGPTMPMPMPLYPHYQPPIMAPYPVQYGPPTFIPPQPPERYPQYIAPFFTSSGFPSNRNEPVRSFQRSRATPGPGVQLPMPSAGSARRRATSGSDSSSDSDLNVNPMLRPVPTPTRSALRPTYNRQRTPLRNPLPSLPRNVYDTSPYKRLLTFPKTTELLNSNSAPASFDPPQNPDEKKGLFGRTKSQKSLFRSLSSKRKQRSPDRRSIPVVPAVTAQSQSTVPPAGPTMPVPDPVPPSTTPRGNPPAVKFDHQGILSGFMNHSPHRVLYQNETYPSALHLYEAFKFIGHRPDLAEKIRRCARVHDVYPLSASLQEHVRSDWGQVFLKMMDEVLYLKFKQHPDLRSLLMNTGASLISYAEAGDSFWGEGLQAQGANELGKAMVRVRDRLRDEGYGL